jgi:predicted nucleotidyltransferase
MRIDARERNILADHILAKLIAAIPGSAALFRGSLAEGRADPYSDIDILWEVPDDRFSEALQRVPALMAEIQTVESIRIDPDFQRSSKRRLLFIRFAEAPLFWRVDLDVFAASVGRDLTYDADNSYARGLEWSRTESALANGVAAIKAHLRGDESGAHDLLSRAFERVGLSLPNGGLQDRLLALTQGVPAIDPTTAGFAGRIQQLILEILVQKNSERAESKSQPDVDCGAVKRDLG